jgi:hypothetical protein
MPGFLKASDMYKVTEEAKVKKIEREREEKERKRMQDHRDRFMAISERKRVIDVHFVECIISTTDRALGGHLDATFYGCLSQQHVDVFLRFGYKVLEKTCDYPQSVKKPNVKVNMPEPLFLVFLKEWKEYSISWDNPHPHPVYVQGNGELGGNLIEPASELFKTAKKVKALHAEKKRVEKERERERELLDIERVKDAQFEECKERIMDTASSGYTSMCFYGSLRAKHINELETNGYKVTELPHQGSSRRGADGKTTKVNLSTHMYIDFLKEWKDYRITWDANIASAKKEAEELEEKCREEFEKCRDLINDNLTELSDGHVLSFIGNLSEEYLKLLKREMNVQVVPVPGSTNQNGEIEYRIS